MVVLVVCCRTSVPDSQLTGLPRTDGSGSQHAVRDTTDHVGRIDPTP